jgi:hypothetical protein
MGIMASRSTHSSVSIEMFPFCGISYFITHVGASTVKWTTLDPCSGLSESDPKIYINFEFYELEIHKHLESMWIYKAKRFMFTKNNFKQRICILEDGASGEQVGDIEKTIVKNFF